MHNRFAKTLLPEHSLDVFIVALILDEPPKNKLRKHCTHRHPIKRSSARDVPPLNSVHICLMNI